MNECFIVPCYSAVSEAGPPKVRLGAGMKAISSLALTKCELVKSLCFCSNAALLLPLPTSFEISMLQAKEHEFKCGRYL